MPEIATLRFADIALGHIAQFEVELTADLVDRFAAVSGDRSPLHMDEAYAKSTAFGGRVAHGLLGASFFSRLIGMQLPGSYALYLSQELRFREPMKIGMHLIVRGTVLQRVESAQAIKLKTEVIDRATSAVLIDGEALVKVLE